MFRILGSLSFISITKSPFSMSVKIFWLFFANLNLDRQLFFLEYPKSVLSTQIKLPMASGSSNVYYKIQFPSKNNSCCWEEIDSSEKPVHLISYLNFIEIDQINNPPIGRFPSHIHVDLKRFHQYSLEIFDPDGDLFECALKSSIDFLSLSSDCLLTSKSSTKGNVERILIEIEIIEYFNHKKDQIRSRLPYHIIALIDDDVEMNDCNQVPLINLLNIENNQIHIEMNEPIQVDLKSISQCPLEMDECLIQSSFHWKIKLHNEKTNLLNNQNEIDYQFEWIPKSNPHCGYHIHCIRCSNNNDNFLDKCINIFVYGPTCRTFLSFPFSLNQFLSNLENANQDHKLCSWSSFSSWSRFNQTTYKRQRTCLETSKPSKTCPFCFRSSFQYQSSLAFIKGFHFFFLFK